MYHNEALVARFGLKDREWADRLMVNMTYSQNYKDMQTGVRQDIVYGEKHRKSHSLMPGVEYVKRSAFGMGLDIMATANYNHNVTTNTDTAQYKYNWRGEKQKLNSPGEQSRQHSKAINSNFNTVLNLNYRFWRIHSITLNNTLNAFWRRNASLLAGEMTEEARERVYELLDRQMARACEIVDAEWSSLNAVAQALIERQSLSEDELAALLKG